MYVVTGTPSKKKRKTTGVFQEYRFYYDSERLPYIVENIEPDIAIIDGKMNRMSDYIAGITNIMLALDKSTIQKLLFLSELSIFEENPEKLITEETMPTPKSDYGKVLLLAEKITREYAKDNKYQLNIIRISELYGYYKNDYLDHNICADLCKRIIHQEKLELSDHRKYSLLYIDDAVDGIYKIMTKEQTTIENIFHLASEFHQNYSELDLMKVFADHLPASLNLDWTTKEEALIVEKEYSIDKMQALYFTEKHKLKDKVKPLYQKILRAEREPILIDNHRESLLARLFKIDSRISDKLLPYIENIVFFILLNLFIYVTRSMNFHQVVDLYLIYVVVISLIYGFEQSVFSIFLSVIAKVYITVYTDIDSLSLVNESLYMWILFIFTIGVLVGYLKEQYKLKYADLADENEFLEKQLGEVKEINEINTEVKEVYEERLLNYGDSFGTIYEIASALDVVEPQAIIYRAIRVVQEIMNTKEVSIYIVSSNQGFFRLIASSAGKNRNLKKSLQVADYRDLIETLERKEVYINKDLKPDYPLMASGIYQNNHLQSIIMIWSLPFESNNLYEMNVLSVTSKLIESKLNAAYDYMSNLSLSYDFKFNNMLDARTFTVVLEHYQMGADEGIAPYCLLKVKNTEAHTQEEFIDLIKENIRETDYLYVEKEHTNLLLTYTSLEDAQYVIDRLQKVGLIVEEGGAID